MSRILRIFYILITAAIVLTGPVYAAPVSKSKTEASKVKNKNGAATGKKTTAKSAGSAKKKSGSKKEYQA